jgi:hypothetical protein
MRSTSSNLHSLHALTSVIIVDKLYNVAIFKLVKPLLPLFRNDFVTSLLRMRYRERLFIALYYSFAIVLL